MEKPRGRTIALSSIGLGLAVLFLTGIVLKDRIREEYFLYKLESSDQEEKKAALEKLGRFGSARSFSVLLNRMKDGRPEFLLFLNMDKNFSGNVTIWDAAGKSKVRLEPVHFIPDGALLFSSFEFLFFYENPESI